MGAKVIEKHFIINKKIKTQDNLFSINTNQLRKLKNLSKIFYLSTLSSKIKKNTDNSFFKRSLYFSSDLKKNTVIKKKHIKSLRPNVGICASKFYDVVGKKLNKSVKKNTPIFRNNFK